MLVRKDYKKLVLNLRNPERVLEAIPHAKTLAHDQGTLVVVPHRDDEVRVLKNLGFDPPTPIDTYYDWPCIYDNGPMAHQRETSQFLTLNPRAYCLNGMGSGKTLSGLWAFDWLRVTGRAKRLLVVAPLSTLTRTWYDEVFSHFPHLTCAVLHGSQERRLKLLAVPHDIYVINHDGIKSAPILDALCARDDIDVVIVDELAVARTAGTARFKALNRLITGRAYAWGFTGTPTPNAPTDAWAQCKLITPGSVPKFFGQFRDATMRQLNQFKYVAKPDALQTVYQAMQPAIRFSREECIDLPPTTYQTREVPLTPQQTQLFNDMVRTLKAEHDGGQVLAVNEAVKLGKLIQICCLAANTLTLTPRGWVRLTDVRPDDLVWDGVEWVPHAGVLRRGVRRTITRAGVRMTPDHLVMTTAGWVEAERIRDANARSGFDWAAVRLPADHLPGGVDDGAHEVRHLAVPVRLREGGRACEPEPPQDEQAQRTELRVPAWSVEHDARHVRHAPARYLGSHAATVPGTVRQRLEKLRWAWRHSVRRLGGIVRRLLGGHAGWLRPAVDAWPKGQQRAIFAGELPLGDFVRTGAEQAEHGVPGHAERAHDLDGCGRGVRHPGRNTAGTNYHASLAAGPRVDDAGEESVEEVFDLALCGPRSRFTVRASDGRGMLVHNCGFAYGLDGDVDVPCAPRIEVVKEIIDEAEGKVIVFVPYTKALLKLATALRSVTTVECVYGEVAKHERDRIFRDFQKAQNPRVLVADARTMSHGLSLTAANTIVWYGPTTSTEVYMQACERIPRPGQKLSTHIIHIESTPVERAMYDRLRHRKTMNGALLDLIKGGM